MKPSSPPIQPAPEVRTKGVSADAMPDAIATEVLFGRRRELAIEHAGCLYRLRITQNNKLILTK